MSLSKQIFVALAGGVAVGLFFGEKVAFLSIGGRAFIQLLQITALWYVAGSLIYGFGSLGSKQARLVFTRGGALLLLLWALTLGLVFLARRAARGQGRGVLQRGAAGRRARDRLGQPLHPLEPLLRARQQRGAGGRGVRRARRHRAHGNEGQGRAAAPARGLQRGDGPGGRIGGEDDALRDLRDRRSHRGHDAVEEFERLQGVLLLYAGFACLLTFWLLPGLVAATTHVGHRRLVAAAQTRSSPPSSPRTCSSSCRCSSSARASSWPRKARATSSRRSSSTYWCPRRSTSPTRPRC